MQNTSANVFSKSIENKDLFRAEGYIGNSTFSWNLKNKAREIGKQRTSINKVGMQEKYYDDYYYRGDKSESIETLGILGELIARGYLDGLGISYSCANLVDIKPLKCPDIICNGKKIDVKGVRWKDVEFRVNERAHNKDKDIEIYWFILIGEMNAEHFVFRHSSVSSWGLKKCTYTPAYCKTISDIYGESDIPRELDYFM